MLRHCLFFYTVGMKRPFTRGAAQRTVPIGPNPSAEPGRKTRGCRGRLKSWSVRLVIVMSTNGKSAGAA